MIVATLASQSVWVQWPMILGMHWVDWLITILPMAFVLWVAVHARKYVRGVADFLAAGRVAGRYVISVGDMSAALSVIYLVAAAENQYRCGMAMSFWNNLTTPLGLFMGLTGFVVYRWRQTRCLSSGQFFEMRYSRPFRVVASIIRTIAEMVTNAIGPAIAARFFIYFLNLPLSINCCGFEFSTYSAVIFIALVLALVVVLTGGRVSLLVTDALQGLMSYPIFVCITVFVLTEVSWAVDVAPVMLDRAPGESFLNPMDIESLRDFNVFALIVGIVSTILNRGAWIGNDTSNSGRNAHEQKMAGILGTWRNGFSGLMMTVLGLFVVTFMLGSNFSDKAREVRNSLVATVSGETVKNPEVRERILKTVAAIPAEKHQIGKDAPYSQAKLPDNPYMDAVRGILLEEADKEIASQGVGADSEEARTIKGKANRNFQEFKTLYHQAMLPVILKHELPIGMMGLFIILMLMLLISTDDSRIFNAGATLVQDVVMPLRKTPFTKEQHLRWLRLMSCAVALFFFVVSLFFAQLDYINMFLTIMCAVWTGSAGPILLGGLYTRWGTTLGAWAALFFGSGTSIAGLALQRNWSEHVYPWLEGQGWLPYVDSFYKMVNDIFSPLIVWELNPTKFAPNSYEIFFTAMILGCLGYTVCSLLSFRKPFNLDRMLHRGAYADENSSKLVRTKWNWDTFVSKVIGITNEYTTGDKIISWSVFIWSLVIHFFILFIGVWLWDIYRPWGIAVNWSTYFFFTVIVSGLIVGAVSTVWFIVGGAIDLRRLFHDLAARVDNPLDDGWVDGHVARVDRERFDKKDEELGLGSTIVQSREKPESGAGLEDKK